MINVKAAVETAREFANDVLEETATCRKTLEEVELSEDSETWRVVLGVDNGSFGMEYKVVTVRASDGEVIAMMNRKVPGSA